MLVITGFPLFLDFLRLATVSVLMLGLGEYVFYDGVYWNEVFNPLTWLNW